ncbi:hypothetical protein [Photobacterium sp. GSS17]|uniref:hypothetical protein n=1 Tax=Photobacterium sp. GSS17 TaxID=3020715 RepID=UPI00235EB7A2|nr:hypothetical protein [Photobacterium sp. GSS17]
MIETKVGVLDGGSWEDLCQQVFKRKYLDYQEMVSSPGDWGIEGFVRGEGIAIQCYCPDKWYSSAVLHTKIVAKITKDLKKLETYKIELGSRIGNDPDDLIKRWIFLIPSFPKNDIYEHLQKKEKEIRGKNLPFISSEIKLLIHTIDDYYDEILTIQNLNGVKVPFSDSYDSKIVKIDEPNEYSNNIFRKNKVRCTSGGVYKESRHLKLNEITEEKFILGDELIRKIEKSAPEIYRMLSKKINQYEKEVEEICCTWFGTPSDLIDKVKSQLKSRLINDDNITGSICNSDIDEIVDHMVSKWIALCPLEVE